MISRLVRKLPPADALGSSIVFLSVYIFTNGISSSLRNSDTGDYFWFCLAALWIGLGLGKTRFRGSTAFLGITVSGILLIWVLRANLLTPLAALLQAVFSSIPKFVVSMQSGESFDALPILETWRVISQTSSALTDRLQSWLAGLNSGLVTEDALILGMIWTLLMWLCSGWMGWFVGKRSAVVAFLPSLALLAAVTSYSERRFDALWLMTILLLFLMGLWNYRMHTHEWLEAHVDYSDSIRFDTGRAVMFLTMAIGAMAIITPSVSWQEIAKTIRDRQTGNLPAEVLGIREPSGTGDLPSGPMPSLPRDHLLTGGFATSERIVMTIRTGDLPPMVNPSSEIIPPRYYWRSTVYDRYLGAGWVTSTVSAQFIPSNTPLLPGFLNGYRLLHLDVNLAQPEGRLFWSGTLLSADTSFTANWRIPPPSDLFADQSELLMADLFAAVTDTDAYKVDANIPIPTLQELRSASGEYPEEIQELYLQLPLSLPDRVHELAHDITVGLATPYERAKAIETYLRTNYPYDLDVPSPPEGQDVADYFLFDLKRGYCDYYATAMVVLARASGVPARFVSGFSGGSYDAQHAQYIVRELHAHSWVEVYFPQIGWVEFEPTASLPEIERAEESFLNSDPSSDGNDAGMLARFRLGRILLWSSPVLLLLSSAILYFAFLERWLILRLAPETVLDRVYRRFYRAGRSLAGPRTRAETSSEFLEKLVSGGHEMWDRDYFRKLKEKMDSNAIHLTNLYHASLFVDRKMTKQDASLAWRIWRRVQRQLFILRLAVKLSGTLHDRIQ